MNNQEIIEKAIKKALDNGFKELDTTHLHPEMACYGLDSNAIKATIFSHDFAKALWGKQPYGEGCHDEGADTPIWKYRLVEMVLAKDPIKYLEAHLD